MRVYERTVDGRRDGRKWFTAKFIVELTNKRFLSVAIVAWSNRTSYSLSIILSIILYVASNHQPLLQLMPPCGLPDYKVRKVT